MKNGSGIEKIVDVDDTSPVGYGGFGTVFSLPSEPKLVAKRVELNPPQPIGNTHRYVAHISTTKERLLGIKTEEESKSQPRRFIFHYIDEIVEQALSTHWCFDTSGLQISAVWFLQKRAPGKSLLELFHEEPPPTWERMRIAQDVLRRMRTLRRADLIHLDCVADNIFIDLANKKTVVIDLDGCGVVRRLPSPSKSRVDEWEHPPLTLGHLHLFRPPPWYPQVDVETGPKAGNYLFAERWVVIDTIIRILTWNRINGGLSWMDQVTRKPLVDGYWNIRKVIEAAKANGIIYGVDEWTGLYSRILAELRTMLEPLSQFSGDAAYPSCLDYFANLSQVACLDPRMLGSQQGSPYEIYRRKIE
jgi:hypothetical protein